MWVTLATPLARSPGVFVRVGVFPVLPTAADFLPLPDFMMILELLFRVEAFLPDFLTFDETLGFLFELDPALGADPFSYLYRAVKSTVWVDDPPTIADMALP